VYYLNHQFQMIHYLYHHRLNHLMRQLDLNQNRHHHRL
jgi:hypothetical protein